MSPTPNTLSPPPPSPPGHHILPTSQERVVLNHGFTRTLPCSKTFQSLFPVLAKPMLQTLSSPTSWCCCFFLTFSPNPNRNLAAVGLSLSHVAHTTPTTSCVTPSQQSGCSPLSHHLLPKASSNSHLLGGDHLHPPVQTSGQSYPHVLVILALAVLCLCFHLATQHWIYRIRHKKPCLYCVRLSGSLATVCVPGC